MLAAFAIACTSDEAPPPATAPPPGVAIASPTTAASPTRPAADSALAGPPPDIATLAPPGSILISVGAADHWEHRTVARGDSLDAEHGILFVDAASGAGELWAVSDSSLRIGLLPFGYSSSPGGRFVLSRFLWERLLADRESGVTYNWGTVRQRLVGQPTDSGLLLMQFPAQ